MKCLLTLLCFLFLYPAFAQRTELQTRAGSGFFFFHGSSTEKNQNGWVAPVGSFDPYTRPYGRKPGIAATIEVMLKRVTKSNFIMGINSGYQRLSSRSTIDTIFIMGDIMPTIDTFPTEGGTSTFKSNFINLAPFAGRRIVIGKTTVDFIAGVEFGFLLKNREDVTIDGLYTSDVKKYPNSRKTDIRLHVGADINIRRLVVFAKYARGITNYYRPYTGGQPEAYSNFVHIGLGYQLR
jgi:hypothetical protein